MHYVRSFFRTVGMFWAITIIALVLGGGAIFGLIQAGYFLDTQNVHHQATINNAQYAANRNSQAYQDTFVTEINQGMTQITQETAEMARDKASGNTSDYGITAVEAAAQAGELCGYGEKLTQTTVDTLPSSTVSWFQTNCNNGVVAPTSEFFIPSAG